jgi:hypothetical protein
LPRTRTASRALAALGIATALAVTGGTPATAAVAPPTAPVPNYDDGLFGKPDVFSAAYKQALALLAISTLDDAQVTPDDETAVGAGLDWLAGQQCANGGWQGYKLSGVACGPLSSDPSDSLAYVGADSNTTALVVQAFAAFGVTDAPVPDALDYLRGLQNADGGFEFSSGSGSDPNSTALAIQAFLAVGTDPATLTKGSNTPYTYLQGLQLDCAADADDQGGIQAPFAPGSANAYATVQSVPALAGSAYPVEPASTQAPDGPHLECPTPLLRRANAPKASTTQARPAASPSATSATTDPNPSASPSEGASDSADPSSEPSAASSDSAAPSSEPSASPSGAASLSSSAAPTGQATAARPARVLTAKPALAATTPQEAADLGATWVADHLTADGYLDSGFGSVDFANTAYAILGFAASGTHGTAMAKALAYFASHLSGATQKGGADDPGSLGLTALAAFAGGLDPTDFGTSDLITRIEALQYFTPEVAPSESPSGSPAPTEEGVGTTSGSGSLPFTGFATDSWSRMALLTLLLGAALVGGSRLRAPTRGRHAA